MKLEELTQEIEMDLGNLIEKPCETNEDIKNKIDSICNKDLIGSEVYETENMSEVNDAENVRLINKINSCKMDIAKQMVHISNELEYHSLKKEKNSPLVWSSEKKPKNPY